MAPFGLSNRQSGWGQAASGGGRNYGTGGRGPLTTSIVLLILGAILGFGLSSLFDGDDNTETEQSAERIIGYQVADMANADRSDAGAVKAATALLVGLPAISVETPEVTNRILTEAVAPDALEARTALDLVTSQARLRLLGENQNAPVGGAKILVIPASYKVRVIENDSVTVQIWRQTVFLESTGAVVQGAWNTDDVGLRWTDDRWKVSSYSQTSGPTPPMFTANGQFSTYADLQAVLNNSYAYHPSLAYQPPPARR